MPATPWKTAAKLCACLGILFASIFRIYRHTLGAGSQLWWRSYSYSELLIDYRAGFVRRGLLGQLLHHLSGSGPELHAANALVFANFALFAGLLSLLFLLSRNRSLRAATLILLIPGGLAAMAVTGDFFPRKEAFFYTALAFTGICVALLRRLPPSLLRRLAASALLAAIFVLSAGLMLVHEAFLFLSAPAQLLLILAAARLASHTAADRLPPLQRRIALAYIVWVLLAAAILFCFHGKPDTGQLLWAQLNPADRALISPDGPVSGGLLMVSSPLLNTIMMPVHAALDGWAWLWLVPILGLALYSFAIVALQLPAEPEQQSSQLSDWGLVYLFLWICTLPVFALGWDWGRWIASINLSFLILWLALPSTGCRALLAPLLDRTPHSAQLFHQALTALTRYAHAVRRHRRVALSLLLLFALTYRLTEGAMGPLDSQYTVEVSKNILKHYARTLAHALHP